MFDVEAMERQVRADEQRVREMERKWRAHDLQIRMAIEAATLQYGVAMAQMWAAALRPAFQTDAPHD